ncbi:unnamed protein product [Euphydryas editha]|uniref:NF-kappa-B inhibitor cactus n=1 Tax=Euphydryas editha TaxID=104508 RepID=A0AAU9VCH2_EUPED|nr:unnamed protein product [Euphydryas editha]
MSAKKVCDTKIFEDETTDSGFLSGPLSEQLLSSDNLDTREEPVESDNKVISECLELDSGVDLCLSEGLSNVNLSDPTPTPQAPLIVIESETTQQKNHDIPPLAILFQQDDDGDTQLHIAAVHGCEKSVGTLIRVCPDKAWLNVPNDYGHTALHLAVMSGHAVVTRMLVLAGASLATRDVQGETPFHKAVTGNHLECLQALLSPVPDHPPRKLSTILNQKNYRGQSCVHLAANAGHIETLQRLVYFGADINAREGLAGWTPLHVAARRGDARLVQFLLQRCACAPDARDYAGRTPRRLARSPRVAALLPDDDDDSDDDVYDSDSDSENLFERIRQSSNPINVA